MSPAAASRIASARDCPPCQITPGTAGDPTSPRAPRIRRLYPGSRGSSWILSPTMCTSAVTPRAASSAGSRVISSVFHRGANFPV